MVYDVILLSKLLDVYIDVVVVVVVVLSDVCVCVCVLHIKPFFYSSTSSTPSVRTDSSP